MYEGSNDTSSNNCNYSYKNHYNTIMVNYSCALGVLACWTMITCCTGSASTWTGSIPSSAPSPSGSWTIGKRMNREWTIVESRTTALFVMTDDDALCAQAPQREAVQRRQREAGKIPQVGNGIQQSSGERLTHCSTSHCRLSPPLFRPGSNEADAARPNLMYVNFSPASHPIRRKVLRNFAGFATYQVGKYYTSYNTRLSNVLYHVLCNQNLPQLVFLYRNSAS